MDEATSAWFDIQNTEQPGAVAPIPFATAVTSDQTDGSFARITVSRKGDKKVRIKLPSTWRELLQQLETRFQLATGSFTLVDESYPDCRYEAIGDLANGDHVVLLDYAAKPPALAKAKKHAADAVLELTQEPPEPPGDKRTCADTSRHSRHSCYSFRSVCSFLSACSFITAGSFGGFIGIGAVVSVISVFSLCSINSVLSIFSLNSVMSVLSINCVGCVLDVPVLDSLGPPCATETDWRIEGGSMLDSKTCYGFTVEAKDSCCCTLCACTPGCEFWRRTAKNDLEVFGPSQCDVWLPVWGSYPRTLPPKTFRGAFRNASAARAPMFCPPSSI